MSKEFEVREEYEFKGYKGWEMLRVYMKEEFDCEDDKVVDRLCEYLMKKYECELKDIDIRDNIEVWLWII